MSGKETRGNGTQSIQTLEAIATGRGLASGIYLPVWKVSRPVWSRFLDVSNDAVRPHLQLVEEGEKGPEELEE